MHFHAKNKCICALTVYAYMHILHLKPANKAWWRRQGCCQGRQGRHATSARMPSERWQGRQVTPARMPTLFSFTALQEQAAMNRPQRFRGLATDPGVQRKAPEAVIRQTGIVVGKKLRKEPYRASSADSSKRDRITEKPGQPGFLECLPINGFTQKPALCRQAQPGGVT